MINSKLTSIVVLVQCFQPAHIVVCVRDQVDVGHSLRDGVAGLTIKHYQNVNNIYKQVRSRILYSFCFLSFFLSCVISPILSFFFHSFFLYFFLSCFLSLLLSFFIFYFSSFSLFIAFYLSFCLYLFLAFFPSCSLYFFLSLSFFIFTSRFP